MAKKVVIASACRTAIGKMGGALSNTPAADLGAIVIKEALNRAGVAPEMVDEVKMGCVIQAAQGQNVARQASIKAGLPIEVPAITINVVCGSGLKCVNASAIPRLSLKSIFSIMSMVSCILRNTANVLQLTLRNLFHVFPSLTMWRTSWLSIRQGKLLLICT